MKNLIVGGIIGVAVYALHPVFDLNFWVAIVCFNSLYAIAYFDSI